MCLFKAFGWQTVSLPVSWHLLPKCLYVLNLFCTCYDMKLQPPPGPQVHPESCTGTHPEMYWEGEIQFTPAPFFGLLRPPFSVYSGPLFGLLRPPFRFTPDTFFHNPQQKHTLEKFTPGKSGFTPGHFRVYSGLFSGTFSGLLRDIFGFTPGHFRIYCRTCFAPVLFCLRPHLHWAQAPPFSLLILPQKLPQSWVLANCWVVDGLLLKVEWCCLTSLAGWLADFL